MNLIKVDKKFIQNSDNTDVLFFLKLFEWN